MAEGLVISDVTYAGEAASYMITRAVVGADTIEKGCINVQDGIKKKFTIPRVEVSNMFQKRKATPTSQGVHTVDAVSITPEDIMLYTEFNPRDYEAHWFATQLNDKLIDAQLPQTAEAFTMMQVMKRSHEFFENHIWRGRKEYDTEGSAVDPTSKGDLAGASSYYFFDGIIKKALDNASSVKVSSPLTLVAGTASGGEENIGAALYRAYNLVPNALKFKYGVGGLKVLMSYGTKLVYEQFLTVTNTFKNNDTTEKGIDRYLGYDIVPLAGMPANTFIFCIAKPDIDSNLWLGVNSMEDNQLQLQRLQNNSELFFIKGLFKMDTQIGFADQLVIYTKLTA
jgi:hypothetical protein